MISDERIERAARAIFRGLLPRGYSEAAIKNRWFEDDDKRNEALSHARNALTADAPEITVAEIRGLEMAKEMTHAIGMAYVAQKLHANVSQLLAGRAHMASRCAAQIADAILARIAELKAKTEPTGCK